MSEINYREVFESLFVNSNYGASVDDTIQNLPEGMIQHEVCVKFKGATFRETHQFAKVNRDKYDHENETWHWIFRSMANTAIKCLADKHPH